MFFYSWVFWTKLHRLNYKTVFKQSAYLLFQSIWSWSLKRKGHRNIKIYSCHFWYVLHLDVISFLTEWLNKVAFFCYFVCIKWDNSFWGSFLFLNWKGRGVWGKESALEQVHNDNFSVSLKSSTQLYIDKHWLMGPGTSHCIQCVWRLCVNSTLVCLFREVYWFLMTNLRIQCSIFFFRKPHHPVNHHSLFTNLFAGI